MTTSDPGLVPWPREVALGDRVAWGAGGVRVVVDDPALLPAGAHAWFTRELAVRGVVVHPGTDAAPHPGDDATRDAMQDVMQDVTVVRVVADAQALAGVPQPAGVAPGVPVDERYALLVAADEARARPVAGVTVRVAGPVGTVRALATVAQLATPEGLPAGRVLDGPRFRWRGLSLDVVRHPFGVDDVRAVVDLLARYKLSVLHLHLTDGQGWRVASRVRPLLGQGDPVAPLTHEELEALTAYAADLGVTVLPEVDLPGHAYAAWRAYPGIGPEPLHPVLAYVDPDAPDAAAFVRDVVTEVAGLGSAAFVHVGGDEPFGMPQESYVRAARQVLEAARATPRRAVVWQEAARSGALTADDVVQYWIGPENRIDPGQLKAVVPGPLHRFVDEAAEMFDASPADLGLVAAAGAPVIVSTSDVLYLDRPYAEPAGDPATEERRARVGMRGYPAKTLRQTFGWDPQGLPEVRAAGVEVAGVEAAVWCETVEGFDDLAFLVLPRLAGAAEKAWSAHETAWEDHRERLRGHREVWAATGWGAAYWPAEEE